MIGLDKQASLIDSDSLSANWTSVVQPPAEKPTNFEYNRFPEHFNPEYFETALIIESKSKEHSAPLPYQLFVSPSDYSCIFKFINHFYFLLYFQQFFQIVFATLPFAPNKKLKIRFWKRTKRLPRMKRYGHKPFCFTRILFGFSNSHQCWPLPGIRTRFCGLQSRFLFIFLQNINQFK